ncbi:MAG: hypothetical protein JNL61_16425, partial [Rhizobiaceae bacterium]|nr:hypothetical protein [Rhizobiaceae bacterium]
GRADRIKAYTIATSVFGRDVSFDPHVDSIVRIEAGRLRRTLERYYLTGGQQEPLQLVIPKGSYAPVVIEARAERSDEAVNASSKSALAQGGPVILIEQFEQDGDSAANPNFASGLTRSLAVRLTRFTSMRVYMRWAPAGEADVPQVQPDYILRGSAALTDERLQVETVLIKAGTGQMVWADSYQAKPVMSELFALKSEIADTVARELAQPYGIIFIDKAKDSEGEPPSQLTSYSCVLYFYKYGKTFDRLLVEPVRQCLERTIVADPNYAEAFACLSLVYSNIQRFRHNVVPLDFDPSERALELANHAIELAPNSSWSHYARSVAYWFANDVSASLASLETGRRLNPNDMTILAELGQRYAFLMEWEKAVPLLDEAFARKPAQPGGYRIGMFLYHLAQGRFEHALNEARRVLAPHVLYGHVAVAIAAAELGRRHEDAEAVERILTIDPDYGNRAVADLESRNLHAYLIERILVGLKKAA